MSYENDDSISNYLRNLVAFLAVALLVVYAWNALVWLFFRHLGWGYVPVNFWTPFLGWFMAFAFIAPFAMSHFGGPAGQANPNAYIWAFVTYPAMILLLRLFPRTA